MLKIRLFLSILLLWTALSYVSAQDSLLDGLEVITEDNAPSIEQIAEINYGTGTIRFIIWSPDGTRFAVVRETDNVRVVEIWDMQSERLSEAPTIVLTPESVDLIRWLPDGQSIVTHGQYSTDSGVHFDVQRWDAETGELLETLLDDEVAPANDFDPVVPPILGWNRNYTQYATLIDHNTLRLSNGDTFSGDYGEFGTILQVIWSPDEQYFVVLYVTGFESYRLDIVDSDTLESSLLIWGADDYYVYEMAWSPDSTTLVTASVGFGSYSRWVNVRPYRIGEEVCYGDCENRFPLDFPESSSLDRLSFGWSPDSRLLAISKPMTLNFYDTETLLEIASVRVFYIATLAWHPSGKLIATGNTNGTIGLWGVPSS